MRLAGSYFNQVPRTNNTGQILQKSLDKLQKLYSPAKEHEMKKSHDKLFGRIDRRPLIKLWNPNSFVVSVIKGVPTMEELEVFIVLTLASNKLMSYM